MAKNQGRVVQHDTWRCNRTLNVNGGYLPTDGARWGSWRWHKDIVDDSCGAQRLDIHADSFAKGVPGQQIRRAGRRGDQRLAIRTRRNAGRSAGCDTD